MEIKINCRKVTEDELLILVNTNKLLMSDVASIINNGLVTIDNINFQNITADFRLSMVACLIEMITPSIQVLIIDFVIAQITFILSFETNNKEKYLKTKRFLTGKKEYIQTLQHLNNKNIHQQTNINLLEAQKQEIKTEVNAIPQKENKNNSNAFYKIINESAISYIFKALNEDAFSLSKTQFSTLVEHADFSSIYGTIKGNKAKIKWMISCLSICMGNIWYEKAANSIEVKPKSCSGANVAEYIKNKLNKEKLQEIIKKEQ